ncbi:Cof-type HAD-IIB family hydrolase [Atopobacter phocae]|uniref:Cof-type HAD-IIB family hydrolase n=1 Tax=Atopobacter phocae TaxID=136492 RepID=UPI000470134F|nr:Cof-type HAD-IIB family hydrolase [Atopobacter phocae]
MTHSIKAIVLDIDGTLLTSQFTVSEHTQAALIEAQKRGIRVVLASGRQTNGLHQFTPILQLDQYNGYFISYNGGQIYDVTARQILHQQTLDAELVTTILKHTEPFDVIPMIDRDDYLYVHDVYNNQVRLNDRTFNVIEHEARNCQFKLAEVDHLYQFVDFPVHKVLLAGDPTYLKEHAEALRAPFKEQVATAFSTPFYYEINPIGVNKAATLARLSQQLNIPREQIVAFGDGGNDREMVEWAGIGVAMENAMPALKEVANYTTTSNNDDGIARFIETYILN